LQFYLNEFTNTQSLRNAVRRIGYCGGNTNTTGGLRLARTEIFNAANGDRSGVPNALVLITDGNPTREVNRLDEEVRHIKRLGVRIVGVGVTNRVNEFVSSPIILGWLIIRYSARPTLCNIL